MCGIAGLIGGRPGEGGGDLRSLISAMTAALHKRGPDGEGIWLDDDAGLALGQRRLAIVDLSSTGAQPMLSHSGRYVLTYNGEIYNFRDLRRDLKSVGVAFRGTSDTEVMLEAFASYGVEAALARLNGMYAFALWDREERTLTLGRDPFGIKPLVYRQTETGIRFGSTLAALLADQDCPRDIDPASVNAYLRHGTVPAPWTILKGVSKLSPGHLLRWTARDGTRISRFWSPLDAAISGMREPNPAPWDALVDQAEVLLSDAVERQMIADVPLGAFLSGGIDSSLVVALMQRAASRPVKTFTIGFEEEAFDEAPHAAAIAAHLGTEHHTLQASAADALALVESVGSAYDEPFADSSQLPTLLLSRMVRQHVTVALSGDGGDELFAGYERYGWGLQVEAYRRHVPHGLRRALAMVSHRLPPAALDALGRLAGLGARGHAGHKLARALRLGAEADSFAGYRHLLAINATPEHLTGATDEHQPDAWIPDVTDALSDPLTRMQVIDMLSYLPDDILTKVDRASMAYSLEARVPLLDTRVHAFAMAVPAGMRRKAGRGKALLRDVLARHVPRALFERPKAGFAVPLAAWLRGPLRERMEMALAQSTLDRHALQSLWQAHLSGREDHAPALWSILMLEDWRRHHHV